MKQLRLVLLVLISFVVMSAKSQNVGDRFKSGQLYYEVTSESEVSVARQHFNEEVTGDVIIPETVTYEGKKYRVVAIGEYAFTHCDGLTSVTISNSVEQIGAYAFADCTGLSSITIPNTVKMIEDFAFMECSGFTSVMIPNSIKEIGMAVFYGCTGLLSVTIPDSVEKIGGGAFSSCDALVTVTIPNSVKEIGAGAFEYCHSLKTVRSKIKEPNSVTLGEDVFIELDTKVRTLQVPKGSKALYQAAEQWSAFANIEEVDYSATTAIRTSETKVWSEDGAIYISSGECGADGTASVYTPAGTLVAVIPLQEGATKLSIASGAYLVQVAGETYKVQVL